MLHLVSQGPHQDTLVLRTLKITVRVGLATTNEYQRLLTIERLHPRRYRHTIDSRVGRHIHRDATDRIHEVRQPIEPDLEEMRDVHVHIAHGSKVCDRACGESRPPI